MPKASETLVSEAFLDPQNFLDVPLKTEEKEKANARTSY